MQACARPVSPDPHRHLRPTLARIFLAGLLAGGLVSRLIAEEIPVGDIRRPEAHDALMMEIAVAPGYEDDDDYDTDGGVGTTGLTGGGGLGASDQETLEEESAEIPPPAPVPGERKAPRQDSDTLGDLLRPGRRRRRPAAGPRTVTYHSTPSGPVQGFFVGAADPRPGHPGVVVIHEWWGLNDHVRDQARRLAKAGYHALAVDLYGGEVARESKDAMALMKRTRKDLDGARANLRSALRFLKAQGAERIGSLGWCMGGMYSLELALAAGSELDAAVLYYGHLRTDPADLEPLRAPLLGLFAENDSGITPAVPAFRAALDELAKPHAIKIYAGADHAFANPNRTKRHNPEYAADAWRKTMSFFETFLVQEE